MQQDIPREILHYIETDEYREHKKRAESMFFENTIFVLILVALLVLSFYMGCVYEKHNQIIDLSIKMPQNL